MIDIYQEMIKALEALYIPSIKIINNEYVRVIDHEIDENKSIDSVIGIIKQQAIKR